MAGEGNCPLSRILLYLELGQIFSEDSFRIPPIFAWLYDKPSKRWPRLYIAKGLFIVVGTDVCLVNVVLVVVIVVVANDA